MRETYAKRSIRHELIFFCHHDFMYKRTAKAATSRAWSTDAVVCNFVASDRLLAVVLLSQLQVLSRARSLNDQGTLVLDMRCDGPIRLELCEVVVGALRT
jgi:hypothetical protein